MAGVPGAGNEAGGWTTLALPFTGWIDRTASRLLQPDDAPSALTFDFSRPVGEPALVAPDSVSWRVFKNPLTLFVGGVGAVLLEFAEPRIRDGVWQHSSFRTAPLTRLQRTGLAAMVTVYGPRSKAEAMIAGVVARHGRVTGTTLEGMAYRANDPELLNWVQATASFGFMEAYHRLARPLSAAERDCLLSEGKAAADLYGATGAPSTQADLDTLFEAMAPRLVPSPIVFEFLEIMWTVPALPGPFRRLQQSLIKAAVAILPDWIRERLELGREWMPKPWELRALRWAGRMADRTVLPSSPAVQSCRRLGLPDDFLYRPAK
ncbi:oxygenase MpaB family protein [Fodinicurvata sp. EGI_FJ10296]|uniref:oxygenase MpaB family protein n=1 Tax=Fodinicurvata sp. EGI_FJ10296 TaxID=3231908 RepID=UPI003454EFFD